MPERFAKAVWDHLECRSVFPPQPRDYGVDPNIAAAIQNQCKIEHKNKNEKQKRTTS